MGWTIVTLIVALAVGAFALPEVRAVLVEFRDRLRDVDIGRVATGLQATPESSALTFTKGSDLVGGHSAEGAAEISSH